MSRSDSAESPERGVGPLPWSDYDLEGKSVTDLLRDFYQVQVLLAVVAFMLWVRLQSYSNFIRDGQVYFSGNDAWYHLRQVRYTVRNWPSTMPFDPWTHYPFGTSVGQFGTLYDQLIATAALVVGLGSPSETLVAKTLLVAPAVFGALVAVPTYLIGKRLGGRLGGLLSAVVLMLLPGTFLRRGLVGFADHNIAEPFFQGFAVVALLVALAVAQRDRPIWELVEAREWEELKPTLAWSALAGVAVGLYIWTWPPAVLLLGIFAVYVAYQAVSDYAGDRSPDHVAFVAVVSMLVAAVMSALRFQEATFSPSNFSLIQPLFALGVAAGAAGLAGLARAMDARRGAERAGDGGFTAVVGVLGAVAVLLVVVVDARPFAIIESNLLRFVGFSAGAQTRTIGEAQPFLQSGLARYYGSFGVVLAEYGFAFVTALGAAVWLLVKPLWRRGTTEDYYYLGGSALVLLFVFVATPIYNDLVGLFGLNPQVTGLALVALLVFGAAARVRYDAEHLFVFVWAAFITSAAFTQVRFNYYLAVCVAALNAYFLREVLRVIGIDLAEIANGDGDRSVPDVETYQVIAVAVAVMLVLVPVLVVPLSLGNTGNPSIDRTQTAVQVGNSTGPGSVLIWDQELQWMSENTPAVGNLAGAGNQDELDYLGTYQRPADGDFEYPKGSYGVMSWWDYGHWITTRGNRIPHANPFQQGATSAANYLLAPSEERAGEVLSEIDPDDSEAESMRYVMVDWQMATVGSKFGAPVVFYTDGNVTADDFYEPVLAQQGNSYTVAFREKKQRYYESQMIRLYRFHGSRAEPTFRGPLGREFTLVFDYSTVTASDGTVYKTLPTGPNASAIRTFPNRTAAEQFIEEDRTAQIGGFGSFPREPVPALQHYRLVSTSRTSAYASGQYQRTVLREARALGVRPGLLQRTQPQWVKTFEKVPGATVRGSGAEPNETLTATVRMRVPNGGQGGNASTFTYRQQTTADADGDFQFVLPYSTTGYAEYGPENGYTNVSVRAVTGYTVTGEVRSNESAYLVRNQATFNVSEGDVNGDLDGEVSIELKTVVLRAPEGARDDGGNNSTDGNTTDESGALTGSAFDDLTASEPAVGADAGDRSAGADSVGVGSLEAASAPAVRAPVVRGADP